MQNSKKILSLISTILSLCLVFSFLLDCGAAFADNNYDNADNSTEFNVLGKDRNKNILPIDFLTNCMDKNSENISFDNGDIIFEPIKNTTKVTIKINKCIDFDFYNISGEVIYHDTVKRNVVEKVQAKSTIEDEFYKTSIVDLKDFAKFNVNVDVYKDGNCIVQVSNQIVYTMADTLNIANFHGTTPVTMFTLNMWGDTSIRHDGPVILYMDRYKAYDWNKLPKDNGIQGPGHYYGMYLCPYITVEDMSYLDWWTFRDIMNDYLIDILQGNMNAHINLCCADGALSFVNKMIYANGITNYNVYLYNEGSWTAKKLQTQYCEDFDGNLALNQNLSNIWTSEMEDAYNNLAPTNIGNNFNYAQNYVFAAICSDSKIKENVLNKSNLITINDDNKFGEFIQGKENVYEHKIADDLNNNILTQGDDTVSQFKNLYKFNESYFAKAEELHKPVLLFIGKDNDLQSHNLDSYLRLIKTYYGDEYCYYYKGHPRTPTSNDVDKQQVLNFLEVEDIDSNVPAELIIFFNPNINLCGYTSTTFSSVKKGSTKSLFEMSKSDALQHSYETYHYCDFWASAITNESDDAIKALRTSNDSYLVEINEEILKVNNYDFAIWDAHNGWLDYYKNNDGNYVRVFRNYGIPEQKVIADGTYYISSYDSPRKVLDVAGGSVDNGANVQLFEFNGTGAQQWKITNGTGGFLTIINVNSGLALDVSGANENPGANIQQYYPNGSDAQKWRAVIKDYKCTIVSALNENIVIDVNAGILDNGSNIQTYLWNNTSAQHFHFCQLNPSIQPGNAEIADGYYKVSSIKDPNKVIDVEGKSMNEGANIYLWDSIDGLDNQVFQFTKGIDGFYSIVSARSGKAVDVCGACVIPGTNIHQWTYGPDNKAQKWAISINPKGPGYIFTNVATGLCIDLCGANTANGTNIDAYMNNGTDAQAWNLSPTITNRQSLDLLATEHKADIVDGLYSIKSMIDNNFVLDISGGSKENCANAQLYFNNDSDAQKFYITHDEVGYLLITNINSGKVLDVCGGGCSPGTNVWQYEYNGSYAQKWIAINRGDGIEIVSALSTGISLDVCGGLAYNSSNVEIWSSNNTLAQRWLFVGVLNSIY